MHNLVTALGASGALRGFAYFKQFIVCQYVPDEKRPGKTHKFPIHPTHGYRTDAHDPAIWITADEAINIATLFGPGYGVGFVFTEQDPFWFIDVDECITAEGYCPIVSELAALFPGCAVDISQSGRGLHFFGMGRATDDRRVKDKTNKLFDLFTKLRFVALTGVGAVGAVDAHNYSDNLAELVKRHLMRDPNETDSGWTTEPCDEWHGPDDDSALIQRALRSQSASAAFGNKASFADLWNADIVALGKCFPHPTEPYGYSEADSALAMHLSFWTGKNCERIQRIMMQSQLYRQKWEREDYLPRTIRAVVRLSHDVLTDKHPEPAQAVESGDIENPVPKMVEGNVYLGAQEQINTFKGCIYVQDMHRIMVPSGNLLKPDQFRVAYGGFMFQMDVENRRSSRDAFEAFTQSQLYRAPKVDTSTFRPDLKSGMIINTGGMTRVNSYVPINMPRRVGDPAPFLNHLRKLLPVERDALILLSYMSAVVQYKGVKFQWCPFIQGVEGNGKSLFSRCVDYAVGDKYSHWPKADQIHKNFNMWQLNKIFIAVEDICISESNKSVWELLKPMITGEKQSIEPKGVDAATRYVCCNYILNGNSKNGIPKTQNDRRAAPLFTAQQSKPDLVRDHITADYVTGLYNWLKNEDGYAIVSELLHTFPIPPEFNPAGACQVAPITSSTDEAISESQGLIDQEILEAIAQGQEGFCGGFISSIALDRLIDRRHTNNKIALNQRRTILQRLGYDWHPALHQGRVNNIVLPDNGKPRLYITKFSPHYGLSNAADVARAYTDSQISSLLQFNC